MRVLKDARVPIHRGITPMSIEGTPEHGVQGVQVKQANGATLHVHCDAVALGYHLRSETQLADLAGCEFRFDQALQQWLPITDEDGRSNVKGVYLAGDGARVRGADAAERAGRLAAFAALKDLGLRYDEHEANTLRVQLDRFTRFASGLRAAFPWPAHFAAALPDDAIVCRCEAITAGELRRVVSDMGAKEANRAKAFSRVGMGRCQGRYCAHAGAEVIAAAARVPLEAVGRLRGQAPVKPMPMALAQHKDRETSE
jgi:bacterioferritin-associated ferredoxin